MIDQRGRVMRRLNVLIMVGGLCLISVAWGQEIYRWVDDKGTLHVTDDPSLIPEKYWQKIQKEKVPQEPAVPPAGVPQAGPAQEQPATGSESTAARKDVLGRGEDWWQAQVKAWKQKLTDAQKNYDVANAAVKAKEKELQESIFKPDSYKRKLEAERKVLAEKTGEWGKQVEEAKAMLEQGLPKQAEEYLADPNWLKDK